MQEEKLRKIKESIRKNWGKVRVFKKIPIRHFNCYMFAICNTEPTEILNDDNKYVSTIGERIPYFGAIGNISGSKYEKLDEYKQALINDLKVLGISAEECSKPEDFAVNKNTIMIAFYSNFQEGMKGKNEFHFLRYVPEKKRWMGKAGYPGKLQVLERKCSIYKISVTDQKRIGIFKLTLIE